MEFYPSVDDYIHIASKVGRDVATPSLIKFSYALFLLLNTVAFPAFLLFNDLFLAGAVLLLLNILALQFVIPWFSKGGLRKYYEQTIGPKESVVARVELTPDGIRYWSDDAEAFWPWKRITGIEETPDAIFFYFLGNGFAVRKSGFAYHDEEVVFVNAARSYLIDSRTQQLES